MRGGGGRGGGPFDIDVISFFTLLFKVTAIFVFLDAHWRCYNHASPWQPSLCVRACVRVCICVCECVYMYV